MWVQALVFSGPSFSSILLGFILQRGESLKRTQRLIRIINIILVFIMVGFCCRVNRTREERIAQAGLLKSIRCG